MATQSAIDGFFQPARAGLVPCYVTGAALLVANTIDGTMWSTCTFIGSSIGGFVAVAFGLFFSFALNGVTFLIAGVWMMTQIFRYEMVVPPQRQKEEQTEKSGEISDVLSSDIGIGGISPKEINHRSGIGMFVEGIRFLFNNPNILILSLAKGLASMIWGSCSVVKSKILLFGSLVLSL